MHSYSIPALNARLSEECKGTFVRLEGWYAIIQDIPCLSHVERVEVERGDQR